MTRPHLWKIGTGILARWFCALPTYDTEYSREWLRVHGHEQMGCGNSPQDAYAAWHHFAEPVS